MLFNRKRFAPRSTRCLYRRLESDDTPPNEKDVIAQALDDQTVVDKFATGAFRVFKKRGVFDRPEFVAAMAAASTAVGEHPFLEMIWAAFLEYWPELLAMLIKLLGL